jgi:hypothetical protein
MAIKIIKPGKEPEPTKRFECTSCGCTFEGERGGLSNYIRHCYRLRCRNEMPDVRREVLPLRNENKEVSNGN